MSSSSFGSVGCQLNAARVRAFDAGRSADTNLPTHPKSSSSRGFNHRARLQSKARYSETITFLVDTPLLCVETRFDLAEASPDGDWIGRSNICVHKPKSPARAGLPESPEKGGVDVSEVFDEARQGLNQQTENVHFRSPSRGESRSIYVILTLIGVKSFRWRSLYILPHCGTHSVRRSHRGLQITSSAPSDIRRSRSPSAVSAVTTMIGPRPLSSDRARTCRIAVKSSIAAFADP